MGIAYPLAQAAVSACFLIKQTVFPFIPAAESLEIAGLWGYWTMCGESLSLFGIVEWWVRYSMGWLHPVRIGPLLTQPLNSAAAYAACVLWSLRLGSWGVLLSRCWTDTLSETVKGETAANGLRGYTPCTPANLKAGRAWQSWPVRHPGFLTDGWQSRYCAGWS